MTIRNAFPYLALFCSTQTPLVLSSPRAGDFWQEQAAFTARVGHTTVFTGTDVIVWGGPIWFGVDLDMIYGGGGVYNLARNTWTPTSLVDAPGDRYWHTAVWTGKEMLIWGGAGWGLGKNAGKYDPQTDTWKDVTSNGAPAQRTRHTAVWTGKEMIVWGGLPWFLGPGSTPQEGLSDGWRYDPEADSWAPIAQAPLRGRFDHTVVWTGSEMLIFGGQRMEQVGSNSWQFTSFADGARYNPTTDTWTPMDLSNQPGARTQHAAAWTGSEMIVWGGANRTGLNAYCCRAENILNTGAIYTPATDSWRPISMRGAPDPRIYPIAVWSGQELIVWGGLSDIYGRPVANGARYNPSTKAWLPVTPEGAPGPLEIHRPEAGIWTGAALFVHSPIFDYGENVYSTNNYTWLYYPDKPRKHPRHEIGP